MILLLGPLKIWPSENKVNVIFPLAIEIITTKIVYLKSLTNLSSASFNELL